MVDYNDMVYIAMRVDAVLESMVTARRMTLDEKLQLKRVIDVAMDQWFEEEE